LRRIRKSDIIDVYPNVEIELRLYLALPVANTEGESSFFALKQIRAGGVLTLRKKNSMILLFWQ